ncbi:DUF6274 family protein [Streptomyces sp. KMM 9044]|uniref:DUF6274 family protein n=1 Tax=Streptomyces sp. KMM 9044 TaxID=2744474 RepID=UPI002150D4B2|nr:DUF6274 family protein [Streptomyces sp. KMM 9044]WAX79238.1 DUF6274 family protein [Streptomyces sp. KMM 9044]
MPASAGHETRALLRAHLSAASAFGHHTRRRPACHRLLRLAEDSAPRPSEASERPARPAGPTGPAEPTELPPERVGGEGVSTA